MFDRQLIGDVAIAFLLAVPTVALSRPQASETEKPEISSPMIDRASLAEPATSDERGDLTEDRGERA